jgi:hypothetical protein
MGNQVGRTMWSSPEATFSSTGAAAIVHATGPLPVNKN